eukprot:scaffold10157_cov142-Skeletonema_dohrnii-CCMP3373.AAC.10
MASPLTDVSRSCRQEGSRPPSPMEHRPRVNRQDRRGKRETETSKMREAESCNELSHTQQKPCVSRAYE